MVEAYVVILYVEMDDVLVFELVDLIHCVSEFDENIHFVKEGERSAVEFIKGFREVKFEGVHHGLCILTAFSTKLWAEFVSDVGEEVKTIHMKLVGSEDHVCTWRFFRCDCGVFDEMSMESRGKLFKCCIGLLGVWVAGWWKYEIKNLGFGGVFEGSVLGKGATCAKCCCICIADIVPEEFNFE